MPVVAADQIGHSFGRRTILDDVSFAVSEGESVALTGRTGSGKSTLLSIIAGLERPRRGTVTVAGTAISSLRPRDAATFRLQHIGVVFQSGELVPTLSALENTALPLLLAGISSGEAAARARDLLSELEITDPDTPADTLSGGEEQRVAIARALITRPALLLADEPTASLDTGMRDVVSDLLYAQPSQRGCALIVISHDDQVANRAGRILDLDGARLSERAPSAAAAP